MPEEILLVERGEVEIEVGDERDVFDSGGLVLVPAMVLHAFRNVGETGGAAAATAHINAYSRTLVARPPELPAYASAGCVELGRCCYKFPSCPIGFHLATHSVIATKAIRPRDTRGIVTPSAVLEGACAGFVAPFARGIHAGSRKPAVSNAWLGNKRC